MSLILMLKKSRIGVIGFGIVLFFIIIGIIAPYIVPHKDDAWGMAYHPGRELQPPSIEFPMGTDYLGRDVFSRVLLGARFALIISIGVVGLALVIGIPIGMIAGYFGGYIGIVLMRITDMFLAFPPLLLAIVLAATLGRGLMTAIIALAISWWPWYSRLVYIQVTSVKNASFMDSARLAGLGIIKIIVRYLLPNTITPIMVQAGLDMGSAILEASALSFLGIGVTPPTPEWGLMIADGWTYINKAWWISLFPGLMLVIVVLGFNLLADVYREYSDPRLRRVFLRE